MDTFLKYSIISFLILVLVGVVANITAPHYGIILLVILILGLVGYKYWKRNQYY